MGQQSTSTFRLFKMMGIINDESKYGQITIWGIVLHAFKTIKAWNTETKEFFGNR